jgi:hypothetical protein
MIIPRLLKNTNIWRSFKTTNMIRHHLKPKNLNTDILNKIYRLKCNNCQLKYVGQTGRSFKHVLRTYPGSNN